MKGKCLLYVNNDLSYFISHRLPIALASLELGYEIHIAAPKCTTYDKNILKGLIFHEIVLSRRGKNPFKELKSIFSLYLLIRKVKPDLIHLISIKPIIYGGLVARFIKVPSVVAAISGLGSIYIANTLFGKGWRSLVNQLYRSSLKHPNIKVIFQNRDDLEVLKKIRAVQEVETIILPGSGVDLSHYKVLPERLDENIICMISRLLKDKGVFEYVEAVTHLKKLGINARFLLVGESDVGNPTFISEDILNYWRNNNFIELLGFRKDILSIIQNSGIIVLPSYREGFPKVLIEAAACGRAVITTDVPGCRDAIEHNRTGLLVPARDSKALAYAIKKLIDDKELRISFGKEGRLFAVKHFGIERIISAHISVYQTLISKSVKLK